MLSPTRRNLAFALLPLLLLVGIYSPFIFVTARDQAAVTMVDYWYHLDWARNLSLSELNTWLHPFYPVGYFALLRVGLVAGADVAQYGQSLSWAGSIVCLVAVYLILYAATKKNGYALAGAALLALHPFFRYQALQEGTDMLAAGLQMLALAAVFMPAPGKGRWAWITPAAAGALLGGAYLIRYTSLILLPVAAVALWWRDRAERRALLSVALFAGAFVIVALPQIVASAVVTGRPLYNEQARNVWFGLYGDFNWTDNWRDAPPDVTLAQIVSDDPAGFLAHWAREFGRFFAYDAHAYADEPLALERKVTLWEPWALHLTWLASAVLLLFDKRLTRPQIFLLLAALFVPVLATSMAWLFTRYLLVPLAIQVVLVVLAAGQVGGRLARTDRAAVGVGLALLGVLALLFGLGTTWGAKQQRTREMVRRVEDAQPLLAAVGVARPDELMTNNRLYQRLDSPDHPQYLLFQSPGDQPLPVAAFRQRIQGGRQPEFLLFDWTSHAIRTIAVAPYRAALAAAKDQLAPLQSTEEYALYCVMPCGIEKATPVNETLGSALTLLGYRAFAGQGNAHGLYLYWQLAASPSDEVGPLSLTLRDEQGTIIWQTTGYPQQGTYPPERWDAGEIVVDFHLISPSDIRAGATYHLTIGLGDSNHITVPIIFAPTP